MMCFHSSLVGHLNSLDYTVCIKSENGFCGVAYTPVETTAGNSSSYSSPAVSGFQMDGAADEFREPDVEFPPKFGEYECREDYIQIPRGHHPEVQIVAFMGKNL